MSRRFISEEPRKRVEPLRYRISPIDKEYDKLDQLDTELDKIADTLDPEVYQEYFDILAARRERLEARRLRELGKATPKATAAPYAILEPHRLYARPVKRTAMSPFAVKILGVCLAFILFKIFS